MSTFTLAISCLTTSNLPWFMDLIFQVPMQYCSLQHRTLLQSPVTSTAGYCFCFDSIPSFFLELFLHWSPVTYWAPTDLGSFSFSILSFCLFILFMGFSRQEYWSGLPFFSPVDHILSDLSTMTHPSWVAPRAWLSFIELDKAVVLVWLHWLVFCEYGFSVLPSDALSQHLLSYLGFLTLVRGYLFMAAPAKLSHCSLPWKRGISSPPPLLTLNVEWVLSALLSGVSPLVESKGNTSCCPLKASLVYSSTHVPHAYTWLVDDADNFGQKIYLLNADKFKAWFTIIDLIFPIDNYLGCFQFFMMQSWRYYIWYINYKLRHFNWSIITFYLLLFQTYLVLIVWFCVFSLVILNM